MKITRDYTNRLIDIELLQPSPDPTSRDNVSELKSTLMPKAVTGIQKAIQRYTCLLLTTINDIKFAPDVGGQLISSISAGVVSNIGLLSHVFNIANLNAIDVLKLDDNNTELYGETHDDERIIKATLLSSSVDTSNNAIMLEIELETSAGSKYNYIMPVGV